jgi:hypothetical protein
VKHSADLFLGVSSLLVLVANFCNLAAARDADRPKGQTKLPVRARFVREWRRHPRLRLTTLICVAGALICWITFFILEFA